MWAGAHKRGSWVQMFHGMQVLPLEFRYEGGRAVFCTMLWVELDLCRLLGRASLGWCWGLERQGGTRFVGPGGALAVGFAALLVRAEVLLSVSRTGGFNAQNPPMLAFWCGWKCHKWAEVADLEAHILCMESCVLEGHLILFINSSSWLYEEEKRAAEFF